MKSKILSMFLFLFFLLQYLFTSSSFAQTPNQEEWKRSFLEGLLGELPNACYSFDPFCFKCLVYMKILPMMFFFLLFFLLFYLIVWESLWGSRFCNKKFKHLDGDISFYWHSFALQRICQSYCGISLTSSNHSNYHAFSFCQLYQHGAISAGRQNNFSMHG